MKVTTIRVGKSVEALGWLKTTMENGKRLPEYACWRSMRHRCNNPNHKYYRLYGALGVSVCKEWNDSFENFINDMGFRPSNKHSLDRFPDKNGNYEPGNCRWATQQEQSRNRRNNTLLEYNGVIKTKIEWAEELGVDKNNLLANKKRTFHEIVEHYKKNGVRQMISITHNGETMGTADWAKRLKITREWLYRLIKSGRPFDEICKKYNYNA